RVPLVGRRGRLRMVPLVVFLDRGLIGRRQRRLQRAAQLENAVDLRWGIDLGKPLARVYYVDIAPAYPRVGRLRLEEADQIVEIAKAGAKSPAIVVRELVLSVGPRRVGCAEVGGHLDAKACQPPGLERRDHEGVIGLRRREVARTQDARGGKI